MLSSWGNILTQVILISITIVLFMIVVLTPKRSQSQRKYKLDLTGTTSLESKFFNDLRDRNSGKWSLADAFFIASGIRSESELTRAREWLEALVQEAKMVKRSSLTSKAVLVISLNL